MFHSEPHARKLPTKKTKTNGFDSLKPTDSLPFLMEKPNSLTGDKPIILLTQKTGDLHGIRKFFKRIPGSLKQKDTVSTSMFFPPPLDLLEVN